MQMQMLTTDTYKEKLLKVPRREARRASAYEKTWISYYDQAPHQYTMSKRAMESAFKVIRQFIFGNITLVKVKILSEIL